MADSYPYKILIEGNDPRGIDVAVMSRYPIDGATSHQEHVGTIEFPHGRVTQEVFRRDCLEVHIQKDHKVLPIFVCHFKSMGGNRLDTRPIRTAEAAAVRQILVNRFGDPSQEPWLVVGDLNDYTETDGVPDEDHALGPLVNKEFSVDWVKRISDPLNRWTHHYQGDDSYHQLDYMLASPMLADLNPQVLPRIIRKGIPHRARRYQGDRFPHIGHHHPKASDHCPVVVDLEF